MRYAIKYVGSTDTIDFSKHPFIYDEQDLFDYPLEYSLLNFASGYGSKVQKIKRHGKERRLVLQVLGNKRENIERLNKAFYADVENKAPAKLFVNEVYVEGYIVASTKSDFDKYKQMEKIELIFFQESGSWIFEDVFQFTMSDIEESLKGFSFPGSFPVSFNRNKKSLLLFNDNTKPTKMRGTIFGPISNPVVTIGNWPYSFNLELLSGERLVIDQMKKTLKKITNSGEIIDVFNSRDKTTSVFEPIKEGSNLVTLNGDFSVEVALLYEKDEPKWT